jgi:hypothetical protein
MDNEKISYIVFESINARFERINKRLWILCIILVIMLISTNIAWLHYVQQFETVTTTIEATQDGSEVNIVGGGDVNYGAESTDNND